ncbi:MAG: alpha/beta hydrolase family protein [Actinomycetota bacterium]
MKRLAVPVLMLSVLAPACGNRETPGGSRSVEQTPENTTYRVGVATVMVNDFISAEVWYPAVGGPAATETYDVRDFAPYIVQSMLTGDAPSTYSYPAVRDGDVASGKFPVVLFSHGFGGFRTQSTFLTAHLAAQGMIVIAPQHPSRDLAAALSGGTFDTDDPQTHLLESLDYLVGDKAKFAAHVDADRVAVVGHSAGGGTALAAGQDDRIDGLVSMASGRLGATEDEPMPAKPSFFLAGSVDKIVPASRTQAAFEAAASPSLYWNIDGVGHNGFDDLCTFGNGLGIIGVAIASGLERLLEMQPQMRTLGEDGCVPPSRPVEETFPVIRDGVTSWLKGLFAGSPSAPPVPDSVKVSVEAK